MNKYRLKFTIWKKQFVIEIYANSKQHAFEELQKIVLRRIIIVEIEEQNNPDVDFLKGMFGIK